MSTAIGNHGHHYSGAGPDPWTCAVCGKTFPVPVLARDHEATHATKAPEPNRKPYWDPVKDEEDM